MARVRWVILGLGITLLVVSYNSDFRKAQEASPRQQAAGGENAERFEGAWTVTSVQRNGKLDSSQIGSQITFTGNQVTFQPSVLKEPKVVEWETAALG